jgi:hypothetical protein
MSIWVKRIVWITVGVLIYILITILSIPFFFTYGYTPTWKLVLLTVLNPYRLIEWLQDNPLLSLLMAALTWSIITRLGFELFNQYKVRNTQ